MAVTVPLEKNVKVTSGNTISQVEDPRLRQRHRGYNNAIGGAASDDDAPSSPLPERRQAIRRQLRQKRHGRAMVGWTKFMHSETKNNIVAMIGEFIGTTMFLFFAFAGTLVANIGAGETASQSTTGSATGFNPTTLLYISLCFGFSLMVNAWVFFRISGGLFNPAVTLALALLGGLGPLRAVFLFIAQLTGACFAAYLVKTIFPTPFNVQTTLGGGTSIAQGLWIEALCTAELVFTIVMLAVEKHRATFIAPVGIGLALFIGELVAVQYTGGSLNPARSFGPAAVSHSFDSHHWIYWIGPLIGTILAVLVYKMFKALEYEMVNPGQDGDVENDPTQNPEHEIAQIVEERQAQVDEIQVIEEDGDFEALADKSASVEGNVSNEGGAVEKPGNEIRRGERDLEANWSAAQGTKTTHLDKKLSSSSNYGKTSS